MKKIKKINIDIEEIKDGIIEKVMEDDTYVDNVADSLVRTFDFFDKVADKTALLLTKDEEFKQYIMGEIHSSYMTRIKTLEDTIANNNNVSINNEEASRRLGELFKDMKIKL